MEPSYQEELIHASLCYTPAVYDKYLGVIFTLKPWPVLKQRPLVSGAEIFHEDRYAVASAGQTSRGEASANGFWAVGNRCYLCDRAQFERLYKKIFKQFLGIRDYTYVKQFKYSLYV